MRWFSATGYGADVARLPLVGVKRKIGQADSGKLEAIMSIRPDLVLYHDGQPVMVVEAKARPVPASFTGAVNEQIKGYIDELHPKWALLLDPEQMRLYDAIHLSHPVATWSTEDILESVGLAHEKYVRESLLVHAFKRWLHDISKQSLLNAHPELHEFIRDMGEVNEVSESALIGQ